MVIHDVCRMRVSMNQKKNGTKVSEKLSDAELSEKLGHYQDASTVWIWVGLIGIAGGIVSYFTVQNTALKAVLTGGLFFGGLCCAIFLNGKAQKKMKSLLQEQLGDFFREEFEKVFGSDSQMPVLPIDKDCLQAFPLPDISWEECVTENFHEFIYRGACFSAANVCLNHVYEVGNSHDGWETRHKTVLQGQVIRCKTDIAAPAPVRITERMNDKGEFSELLCRLNLLSPGRFRGLYREGSFLALLLETEESFADVDRRIDLRNLDAVRDSYRTSLKKMANLLDLLLEDPALFRTNSHS